ncbi:MAG: hypothetical protein AAF357_14155 [Verrucomicrobiota bacterium]
MQAVSQIHTIILGGVLCLFAAGCKTMKSQEDASDAENPTTMKIPVGAVHVVRPDEGFVLIRSTRFLQLEPGTGLVVIGDRGVETSQLRVSPARKGQFVTADIISGMPQVGDQALMDYVDSRTLPSQSSGSTAPEEEIQVLE